MSSFFNVSALGGNPFSTPVGQRIEQATDASLASENWALNMEICDMINESSDSARDAMKAIRKRLTQNAGKNYSVIMYTLTVLETCVKNCGKAFHTLVANKEFIQELVKLIGPKNDPPTAVQEKVLNLIQIWADAFRAQPDLNGVVQVYQELKNKGIEFPVTDLDAMAPIYTPQRSVPEATPTPPILLPTSPQHQPISLPPGSPAIAATGPIATTPEQIAKLQSELDIVSMNMSVLGEMLTELKPGQEDPSDYKLLNDLTQTCKEMQGRIVELIGRINHDEVTAELLRLNDELNNLFLRHQRYEKNRDPQHATTPSAILGVAMGVPISNGERGKDSLIDLSDEAVGVSDGLPAKFSGLGIGTASSQLSSINSVSVQSGAQAKDVDEFDMLAQSRNTNIDAAKPSLIKDHTPGASAQKKVNSSSENANESDFDEMAAWLDKDNEDGPEESLTSKEFDRFLAERAAFSETLPTITSQTGSTNSSSGTPRHKTSKKDEEASLMAL
ncbi:TOM1-like protein 2 isoform X2 [Bradysia coprophila]|uniref:TOM1-like protein 2 isoform X2 n=1 Tax=Bradysia coprophila TaxID=38358 RepID=UPI00187DC5F3|nr:TOM1-like protein 2 isoform X2 [Bradysia coprophila]